jgi:periplasmic protein CpxP/Spy
MKQRILPYAMVLLLPVFAGAQERAAQAAQKVEQVVRQLNLTRAQEAQLLPILRSEVPKLKTIKEDSSLSPMQKMQQLKAVHDQTDPQVKAILTPEQYQKLQEIRRQELEQAIRKRLNQ